MTELLKYKLLSVAVFVIFVVLVWTEVWARASECIDLYSELKTKQSLLLSPQELIEKRSLLTAEKKQLGSLWKKKSKGDFEESPTGVFEYLHSNAKSARIGFSSLTPVSSEKETNTQIRESHFKIACESDYHSMGAFIYSIEEGDFSVQVTKLLLKKKGSSGVSRTVLDIELEGVASILNDK